VTLAVAAGVRLTGQTLLRVFCAASTSSCRTSFPSFEAKTSNVVAGLLVLYAHSADTGATFSAPTTISLPPKPNFTGGGDGIVSVDSCGIVTIA
jgi:hypothetical protein